MRKVLTGWNLDQIINSRLSTVSLGFGDLRSFLNFKSFDLVLSLGVTLGFIDSCLEIKIKFELVFVNSLTKQWVLFKIQLFCLMSHCIIRLSHLTPTYSHPLTAYSFFRFTLLQCWSFYQYFQCLTRCTRSYLFTPRSFYLNSTPFLLLLLLLLSLILWQLYYWVPQIYPKSLRLGLRLLNSLFSRILLTPICLNIISFLTYSLLLLGYLRR